MTRSVQPPIYMSSTMTRMGKAVKIVGQNSTAKAVDDLRHNRPDFSRADNANRSMTKIKAK